MATSVSNPPVDRNMGTAAGAHGFLLALNAHMTAVGLSRVTTGSDYNVAGSSSQLTLTVGFTSAWLAYDFVDGAQAAYPITIWFRLIFGYLAGTHASDGMFFVQTRISCGHSGATPVGDTLEIFEGAVGSAAGGGATAYAIAFTGSLGDFVRYDGNSLTVLLGVNSYSTAYNGYRGSQVEFHLERRYSEVDGSVGPGFTGWFPWTTPVNHPAPPMYAAAGMDVGYHGVAATAHPTVYVSSNSPSNTFFTDGQARSLSVPLLVSGGAAIVAPVTILNHNSRPMIASKMFSVPSAQFSQLQRVTLDFTGADKKYLVFSPFSCAFSSTDLCALFEWE